jgi:hypothetical protein
MALLNGQMRQREGSQFNLVLSASLFSLQLGDILTTWIGIQNGHVELNPLADSIFRLKWGFWLFIGIKLLSIGLVLRLLLRLPNKAVATVWLAALTALTGLVVLSNLLTLIESPGPS